MTSHATTATPAHIGWRLVALIYDIWPIMALWLAASALMLLLRGGEPVTPGSAAALLEAVWLWTVTGAYLVLSWSRGGATLGMRPWRLRVVAASGQPAQWAALAARYAWSTAPALLTLELAALLPWSNSHMPFWLASAVALISPLWSLFNDERAALYDQLSGTRFVRLTAAA